MLLFANGGLDGLPVLGVESLAHVTEGMSFGMGPGAPPAPGRRWWPGVPGELGTELGWAHEFHVVSSPRHRPKERRWHVEKVP